jgi:hypothetical protein
MSSSSEAAPSKPHASLHAEWLKNPQHVSWHIGSGAVTQAVELSINQDVPVSEIDSEHKTYDRPVYVELPGEE